MAVETPSESLPSVPHPVGGGPKPLAVTMGDPAGIGLDISLFAWSTRKAEEVPPFALFACPEAVRERAARLKLALPVEVVPSPSGAEAVFPEALPVVAIPLAAPVTPGEPRAQNASAVIAAIEAAVAAVAAGSARAVVTNPISKAHLYAAGFHYPGHTEFLGALARRHFPGQPANPVMMLASEVLRVVPLTVHIPLRQVPEKVTAALLETTARIVLESLQRDFGILRPRLAVAGLNPHAGEGGALGLEDEAVIRPAADALQAGGWNVTGPHPADTLFHPAARRTYDAVLAMYHDQALIPLKTLAFDTGVNVTLGLPFVRTSPDHGTAFSLAGTGAASPLSFLASLRLADIMAARRRHIRAEA